MGFVLLSNLLRILASPEILALPLMFIWAIEGYKVHGKHERCVKGPIWALLYVEHVYVDPNLNLRRKRPIHFPISFS